VGPFGKAAPLRRTRPISLVGILLTYDSLGQAIILPRDLSRDSIRFRRKLNMNYFVRTVTAPPREFAWAWALERSASEPLRVSIAPELTVEGRTPPDKDELVLWFGVPDASDGQNVFNSLNKNEQARVASFRFETDRWAYAAAHAGLRSLLGATLGCAPHALRFAVCANGKPYLDHKGLCVAVQFSISHTRGCVAVALARSAVGVDVERRRALPDLLAVASMAFAPEGQNALAALSGSEARTRLFYRYWTLGEAFTKATGEGISQDLTSFAFTEKDVPALTRVGAAWGPVGRWRFYCES
jgi:4'-phosphopantetheinyl transferase